ncbi:MAG: hypothetical protein DI640_12895 [Sphingomonas taxi]|uniref:Uncharacterized protein n=1 Tax=Sphingomonas taxi TaxID=1549858 RepID=A0A2W4YRV4_9SPHN|nr:MAG: hypothetical protein DI640_12895 [Sphingomonas taxi]
MPTPEQVVGFCSGLEQNLTSSDTRLRLPADDTAFLQTVFADPAHVFAEIYTLRYHETVMMYDTEVDGGITYIKVQRGMEGTEPRPWPDDACVRVTDYVEGRPCGTDEDTPEGQLTARLRELLSLLNIGPGLLLELDAPGGPRLSLRPTGAVPGTYGGAEINAYGQFTHVPQGWPAAAVPAFDNCCSEPGEGGGVDLPPDIVQAVSGLVPDLAGNVDLCSGAAGPTNAISQATPVFICLGGGLAKTTAGAIAGLADTGTVDVTGLVRSVAGIEPNASGDIPLQTAPLTTTFTAASHVLVVTPDGLRRTTVGAIANMVTVATPNIDADYNPMNGLFEITVNGSPATSLTVLPAAALSYANGTLTLQLGGVSTSVTLPPVSHSMSYNAQTGDLTISINGTDETIRLPVFNNVPVVTERPAGTIYRLVKAPNDTYVFMPDSIATT